MRRFWTLLEKDVRLSLVWFFTNTAVLTLFMAIAIYNVQRKNDVGFLFLLLGGAGVFIWSIFAGVATYFSEREGRIYEFVNSLPVNRTLLLLSKEVWLVLQATVYFVIFALAAYIISKMTTDTNVASLGSFINTGDALKLALSGYLRILLTLTSGMVAAALVKDMPFKWFIAILLLVVIVWALGWIDLSPIFGVKTTGVSDPSDLRRVLDVQLLNDGLRFLASLVLLLLGGVWIERRGY